MQTGDRWLFFNKSAQMLTETVFILLKKAKSFKYAAK